MKNMQVKNLPVVMLAAGLSERFKPEHRITHKSLLKIDQDNSIFDILARQLKKYMLSRLFILLGYKAEDYRDHLNAEEWKKLNIFPIVANADYIYGPSFTLRSLCSYNNSDLEKFLVIPSDTLFHPTILNQIFSYQLDIHQQTCVVFCITIPEKQMEQLNDRIDFSPTKFEDFPAFKPLVLNFIEDIKEIFFVPALILSREFLDYINMQNIRMAGKILPNLEKFYANSKLCKMVILKYGGYDPPFIDIDTSDTYLALKGTKKELIEPYKVKLDDSISVD